MADTIPVFLNLPLKNAQQWLSEIPEIIQGFEIYIPGERLRDSGGFDIPVKTPITLHAPYLEMGLGLMDRDIRKICIDTMRVAIESAIDMKAQGVVFHTGFDPVKFFSPSIFKKWLKMAAVTLEEVTDGFSSLPEIFFENVFETKAAQFFTIIEELSKVKEVSVCFDTGHFNYIAQDELSDWCRETANFNNQLHLHDNDGHGDWHLPPGAGNFPFGRFFDIFELKRTRRWVLEMHKKSHFQPAARWISEIVEKL